MSAAMGSKICTVFLSVLVGAYFQGNDLYLIIHKISFTLV